MSKNDFSTVAYRDIDGRLQAEIKTKASMMGKKLGDFVAELLVIGLDQYKKSEVKK